MAIIALCVCTAVSHIAAAIPCLQVTRKFSAHWIFHMCPHTPTNQQGLVEQHAAEQKQHAA